VRIGARARLDGGTVPIELHAAPGAEIVIGDDVVIEGGVSIEAQRSVTVGDGCHLGAFAKIMDNHFHPLRGDRHQRPVSDPVVIEAGASLGRRAIVLPGARVRAGAAVRPATVVRAPPRAARAGATAGGS
jgi:acetyltransferase-like isoleucine patch superfamily enzyme